MMGRRPFVLNKMFNHLTQNKLLPNYGLINPFFIKGPIDS